MPIALGSGTGDTEEGRAYFRSRLTLLGRWLFLISASFYVVGLTTRVAFGLGSHPATGFHLATVVIAGLMWSAGRSGLRSAAALKSVDAAASFSLCTCVAGMAAALAKAGPPFQMGIMHALFLGLIGCSFTVIARAIALPSTPIRTFAISVVSLLPMLGATTYVLRTLDADSLTVIGAYFDVSSWSAAAVAMAVVSSRVIFGLRAQLDKVTRLGQYTLEEKLGAGGMGVVYRARHALLRRPTAIKLLPPATAGEETILRFEREVQLTAELSHPSTVAIFDYGRTPDGVFYYAMEYLDGLDLQELVEHFGPQPPGRVIHLLQQVCGALAEAHGVGLVHRDIKPANIILCERGGLPDVAKVVDFGLVKRVEAGRGDVTMASTSAQTVLGTPLYMAPEAFGGALTADPRCDLYSLAAVGYFLLTGAPVFTGKTLVEIGAHHLHTSPAPPSSRAPVPIPPALDALLLRGLAKAPAERPADARAFEQALRACAPDAPWTVSDAAPWWTAFRQTRPARVQSGAPDAARLTIADAVTRA